TQRAHDHTAEKHRDVRSHHDTHGSNRTDHATTMTMNHFATRITDQYGQQIQNHRTNQFGKILVWNPASWDEQGRNQTPGDERADVGNDHPGQKTTELLQSLSHFLF